MTDKLIAFINELDRRYSVLGDARRAVAEAEEALLRTKHALADAERALDERIIRAQAAAPDTCRNEVQRKAYALDASAVEAGRVAELRAALVDDEVRVMTARSYLRGADDLRRFLETIAQVSAMTEPPALPVVDAA